MGDVVEDVRTVFEKLGDETIYIPALGYENANRSNGVLAK